NAKEDAEEKAKTFISLARAVLVLYRNEAEQYFYQAVEVASKIGDENLDRWGALLALADRSANSDNPNPEIAYKFSRCAELTYSYVDRDKHFPWKSTVQSITRLCPASSFAITSRWRDRGFGWYKR